MAEDAFVSRCQALKLVLTDVDGVMTDGRIFLLPGGEEVKVFHVRDGLGLVLARAAGLKTGLVSGRSSPEVARRAAELRMDVVRQGVRDKAACLEEILAELGLERREVAYIGDDYNDLGLLRCVGLPAAPADAPAEVRRVAALVTQGKGGEGCLRELIEEILRARGDFARALAAVGAGLA
jgi:3-deoxy-D-manno-octulosonate 8-phosphate phosphatase (KDO 8-P phosphatase)